MHSSSPDVGGAFDAVPPELGAVLIERGFSTLTPIQSAVLQEDLVARDLQIASRTGSGKTVAVGLALAAELKDLLGRRDRNRHECATPAVLIMAPTRELARQVHGELEWLLAPLGGGVGVVTGGSGYGDDRRTIERNPAVLVGTPGRLADHIGRGRIDLSNVSAVCLDEADEMLDMGFREDLEKILEGAPDERRTHLVSATFPREVLSLARRFQRDPVRAQGEAFDAAHSDIDYQWIVIPPRARLDLLNNLLLAEPETLTLVFVRTRIEAMQLGELLVKRGFDAGSLHGDLAQSQRTATLDRFRAGRVRVLVATDVAARGLDVPGIGQVIHFDLPDGASAFTHRSGRTGRAGRKGVSILMTPPAAQAKVKRLLRMTKTEARRITAPGPIEIRRAADQRLFDALSTHEESGETPTDLLELAERLLATRPAAEVVAALLARSDHRGPNEAVEIKAQPKQDSYQQRDNRGGPRGHDDRGERGGPHHDAAPPTAQAGYVLFQVSYGDRHGADARRLLAMVCRRGGVDKSAVGRIRVGPQSSVVEITEDAASSFESGFDRPDPRDPKVRARRFKIGTARPTHAGPGAKRRFGGPGSKSMHGTRPPKRNSRGRD